MNSSHEKEKYQTNSSVTVSSLLKNTKSTFSIKKVEVDQTILTQDDLEEKSNTPCSKFFLIKSDVVEKKKRRKKDSSDKRSYKCNYCQKNYLSYPALYTHKRNKHNIIPITGKQDLFKNYGKNSSYQKKFKYSALENLNCDFYELINFLIKKFIKCLEELFSNPNSVLYNNDFTLDSHEGLLILKCMQLKNSDKINFNDPNVKPCIDDILIVYVLNFCKVAREDNVLEWVIKFVLLIREYLNIVGWDYKRLFNDFKVKVDFNRKGSYTMHNDAQEIPDLINEFISVFIEIDENLFGFELKKLLDLTDNFCNWLFVNNLTSFKITLNEI